MKLPLKRILFLSTFLILTSCGETEPSESSVEKELSFEELYNEFKNSESSQILISFDEGLQKLIDEESAKLQLPSDDSGLSKIDLDLMSNSFAGAYYTKSFIGLKSVMEFYNQSSYDALTKSVNKGLETFHPEEREKERQKSLDYAVSVIPPQIEGSEYFVLMLVRKCQTPQIIDEKTFILGEFEARVIVADTKTWKSIGSFDIAAKNQESLMYFEGQVSKAAREDFEENINSALMDGLKSRVASVQLKERHYSFFRVYNI